MATIKKAKDGTTVRNTLSGGTRTRTVSGDKVTITKTDKAGNVIKNRTRDRIMQDVKGDPSESSGSFARKGAIVKKKMAMGGSSSSALKTFNDNKAMAYKKAGGAMSDYKKYLKKASDGISVTDLPASTNTQGPSAAKDFIPASSGNLPVRGPQVSYSRTDLPFVNAGTIGLNGPIGQAAADAINRQMRRDSAAGRDVKAPFQRRGGSTKMAKEGKTMNPPKGVSWIDKGLKSKPKYEPEALVNKGNPVAYGFNTALKNLLNPTSKDKLPNMPKHKTGGATKFGMLSVKAGIDKNPKPTAADRIAGAKKKNKRK